MSEYATIEHYVNHVIGEITKRDVEQVSEKLRALGWEEIVRCRDCAYSFDMGSRCRKWRGQDCFENSIPEHVEPDGFCAWGERREP